MNQDTVIVGGAPDDRPSFVKALSANRVPLRRPKVLAALFVVTAALVATFFPYGGLEFLAQDALVRQRGESKPAPQSVFFVDVDEETIRAQRRRPPINRKVYARAIQRLSDAGVKVIAIDLQFTEPSDDVGADEAFLEALRRTRVPVVLATTSVFMDGDTEVFGGRRTLGPLGAAAAHSGVITDGGVVRRVERHIEGLETFAQKAALVAGTPGVTKPQVLIDPPVPGDRLRTLSMQRLLDDTPSRFGWMKGRIAVIGVSAISPTGQDRHRIAGTEHPIAGAALQAQAIDTALRGEPLRECGRLVSFLIALVVGLVAALIAGRKLPFQVGMAATTAALLVCLGVVAVKAGYLVDLLPGFMALAIGFTFGLAVTAINEQRKRVAARTTLRRFVPPEIVDELLASEEGALSAPGEVEASVLFVDLRGYTSVVDQLSELPALIGLLDIYLAVVTEIVHRNGGTVVSFQGDGVMAAFGVPVPSQAAARKAIEAATDLVEEVKDRLQAFEALFAENEIRIGVGLATGRVMAGIVGPPSRREYAVVGPTSNLAARLQALSKTEDAEIFMDQRTVDASRVLEEQRDLSIRLVGSRRIRGFEAGINVWTLDQTRPLAHSRCCASDDDRLRSNGAVPHSRRGAVSSRPSRESPRLSGRPLS